MRNREESATLAFVNPEIQEEAAALGAAALTVHCLHSCGTSIESQSVSMQ